MLIRPEVRVLREASRKDTELVHVAVAVAIFFDILRSTRSITTPLKVELVGFSCTGEVGAFLEEVLERAVTSAVLRRKALIRFGGAGGVGGLATGKCHKPSYSSGWWLSSASAPRRLCDLLFGGCIRLGAKSTSSSSLHSQCGSRADAVLVLILMFFLEEATLDTAGSED